MHYPKNQNKIADVTDSAIIERWPASPHGWNLANIEYPFISSRHKEDSSRSKVLKILSPAEQSEFILTGETNADRIQLKSSLDEEGTVYWYYNDQFTGAASAGHPLYIPLQTGEQQVSCMTADGQVCKVTFKVLSPEDRIRVNSGS